MVFNTSLTTHFEREFEALARKHIVTPALLDDIRAILVLDPYNISRKYKIKKLKDIPKNEGEWRLRVDTYRVRYDIEERIVKLYSIRHRREGY